MPKVVDLVGTRIGRLIVLHEGPMRNGRKTFECACDCGGKKTVPSSYLVQGKTTSCGCAKKESAARIAAARVDENAKRRDPLYHRWGSMIQRCHNPKNPSFKNYGARGISVCDDWRASFDAFMRDMGRPEDDRQTIERINNDGDYTPENCRWAYRSDQLRNQRRSIVITIAGETLHAKEWSDRIGGHYQSITKAYRSGGIEAATEFVENALQLR